MTARQMATWDQRLVGRSQQCRTVNGCMWPRRSVTNMALAMLGRERTNGLAHAHGERGRPDVALGRAHRHCSARGWRSKQISRLRPGRVGSFAIAGLDGITDALLAEKAGEMTSILRDANVQAQGSLNVAVRQVDGASFKPQSSIWKQHPQMSWDGGTAKNYNVPWTPVTPQNVDELLASRQ